MIPDRYTPPHIEDFAQNLYGKRIFSKIYLVHAFPHIPTAPEDVPKTAITTSFGLFEATCMMFGLRNGAQTCRRFVRCRNMLRSLNRRSATYRTGTVTTHPSGDARHAETGGDAFCPAVRKQRLSNVDAAMHTVSAQQSH